MKLIVIYLIFAYLSYHIVIFVYTFTLRKICRREDKKVSLLPAGITPQKEETIMNFIRGLSALVLWAFCMVVAIGSLSVGYDLATTGQAATAGWCAFIAVASFVFGIMVPWWLIIPIINSHTSLKDE